MKNGKRILIIDDKASDTRLIKRFLEQGHNYYVVCEENDARAALSTAEKFKPDLILLDLIMPEMDGREVAAQFRTNPKFKTVPIIFLTAAITKAEVEATGGRIGAFPFLAKPIHLREVAACLRRHLRVDTAVKKSARD